MSDVKIAITCACGPLHKWGYQWTDYECIASQAEFADRVYLVQSTEDATGVKELTDKYPNITLVSDPMTWHHFPGQSDEELTVDTRPHMGAFTTFHMRNLTRGRLEAFKDSYRVVMSTHSNWYVPRQNYTTLRNDCDKFMHTGDHTGYGWALGQIHDRLMGPPVRRDVLCNMTGMDDKQVSAYYPDLKGRHTIPPSCVFDICMIDASYNLLPEEFGGMQKRMHYPGSDTWTWNDYRILLTERLNRRCVLLDETPDYWGQRIADKSTPDFMGYQLLQGILGNDYPRYD